ncbi:hypothetical protein Agabi119p4_11441 [Agaricus bisporus var. burnettii]|uniref:Uncharacterized protein n=1 Tax=Agaricus bisporus var. burnettii TaxID=192524 RepID=A0A8H7EUT5_AGABI|nr:hypothetical protein Agabi119p4_11441 [Agaricus bisporus var. burnettii]
MYNARSEHAFITIIGFDSSTGFQALLDNGFQDLGDTAAISTFTLRRNNGWRCPRRHSLGPDILFWCMTLKGRTVSNIRILV